VNITAGGTAPGSRQWAVSRTLVPCITNPELLLQLPRTVLIPIYGDSAACQALGCKGNGQYPIVGFAAFEVTGYSFNGNELRTGRYQTAPTPARQVAASEAASFGSSPWGTLGPAPTSVSPQVYLYS
jgi:hypothetical protein